MVGCALLALVGFAALFSALLTVLGGFIIGILFGPEAFRPGAWAYVAAAALPFALIVLLVASARRGIRRLTGPIDDLIEAAGRIEAGDYSARVTEGGARELRSVERAFNAMSARLESSDEKRRNFLAEVAHELRTPLSVIRGQAEGIADGVYPGDAEHVAPILDATHALEILVDDLRTLVLTDAGSLVLNREQTDPAVLVHDAVATFQADAVAAGVTLAAHIADGVPVVDVDPARIRSVIGNLLSNAIRHTPKGGSVRVSVRLAGPLLVISVSDTGEGIAPELLPHVFERFVKGPDSKGTGLGLAIIQGIVAAHRGSVDIESKVGSGTTVSLKLPLG